MATKRELKKHGKNQEWKRQNRRRMHITVIAIAFLFIALVANTSMAAEEKDSEYDANLQTESAQEESSLTTITYPKYTLYWGMFKPLNDDFEEMLTNTNKKLVTELAAELEETDSVIESSVEQSEAEKEKEEEEAKQKEEQEQKEAEEKEQKEKEQKEKEQKEKEAEEKKQKEKEEDDDDDESSNSWSATFRVTAYCGCSSCSEGYGTMTATGKRAKAGRTIAVDPDVIPYGSKVVINGHTYTAEDCGGAIDGYDIDIYFDSHSETKKWGARKIKCTVYPKN